MLLLLLPFLVPLLNLQNVGITWQSFTMWTVCIIISWIVVQYFIVFQCISFIKYRFIKQWIRNTLKRLEMTMPLGINKLITSFFAICSDAFVGKWSKKKWNVNNCEFYAKNKYVYSISESTEKILRNGQTRYILWSDDFIAHEDNNVQLNGFGTDCQRKHQITLSRQFLANC